MVDRLNKIITAHNEENQPISRERETCSADTISNKSTGASVREYVCFKRKSKKAFDSAFFCCFSINTLCALFKLSAIHKCVIYNFLFLFHCEMKLNYIYNIRRQCVHEGKSRPLTVSTQVNIARHC